MGIEDFGKSAPYKEVYKYFKLTDDDIVNTALKLRR
jgi:transketolase